MLASDGEFTVAKDQYVLPRSGWFSDRSACYLAAGKPVVTRTPGSATCCRPAGDSSPSSPRTTCSAAFDAIAGDPATHGRAAAEIAAEFFDAERVVGRLLAEIGL